MTVSDEVRNTDDVKINDDDSEDWCRFAIDATSDGLYEFDLITGTARCNSRYYTMCGYELYEFPASTKTWLALMHPDDRIRSFSKLTEQISKKYEYLENEYRLKHKNGSWVWILDRSKIVEYDETGKPVRIVGTHIDITERKLTEKFIATERDMGLSLAAASSLEEALNICLNAVFAVSGMNKGGVYLVNDEGGFDLIVHHGLSADFVRNVSHIKAGSFEANTVLLGNPVYIDCNSVVEDLIGNNPESRMKSILEKENLSSIAMIPVRSKGRVIGCLNIASRSCREISSDARAAMERIVLNMGAAIEKLKAEKAFRDSEQMLQLVIDSSLDAIIAVDENGSIALFNNSAEELFQLTRAEAINQPLKILLRDEVREKHQKLLDHFMGSGVARCSHIGRRIEQVFRRNDGSVFTAELAMTGGRSWDRRLVVASIHDISERKQAEDEIVKEKIRYQTLIDLAVDGILIGSHEGILIDANRFICSMLGMAREDIIGKHLSQLPFTPESLILKPFQFDLLYQGETVIRERDILRPDGKIITVEMRSKMMPDGTYQCILSDITERKKAEEIINNLFVEKELLLKEVHHRIKNNMTAMVSILFLQADAIGNPAAAGALQNAAGRLMSMSVLYDKLYRSSNLSDMPVKKYLSPLIDEIAALYPERAGIIIKKEISDFVLKAKSLSPLGIIINELMTNSMKYAFTGGNNGVISISASERDGRAKIVLSDNGTGMDESFTFENSTGFGMSLVAMMVKQLRGTIRIERQNGTMFVIEFDI